MQTRARVMISETYVYAVLPLPQRRAAVAAKNVLPDPGMPLTK